MQTSEMLRGSPSNSTSLGLSLLEPGSPTLRLVPPVIPIRSGPAAEIPAEACLRFGKRPRRQLVAVSSYYVAILLATLANLALAAVALVQRAKQIRGNKLRERQVELAEARNELAEERLRSLQDQIETLAEIRDAVCPLTSSSPPSRNGAGGGTYGRLGAVSAVANGATPTAARP